MTYTTMYLKEAAAILERLDVAVIDRMVDLLAGARDAGGRLFLLGVGGGAGHASHAVCDFRKIGGFEAYAPSDNVSELSARVNDEGWETTYAEWLRGSRLRRDDLVWVFSVGGGDAGRNVSMNLVRALEYTGACGARILGIAGRDGGLLAQVADACLVVPTVNAATVTAHTESFQALIWHLIVTHPKIQRASMKWETIADADLS